MNDTNDNTHTNNNHHWYDYMNSEDVGAADAVADDGEWEPLDLSSSLSLTVPPNSSPKQVNHQVNQAESEADAQAQAQAQAEEVNANVEAVLRAVDDLLAETASVDGLDGSPQEEPTASSSATSSATASTSSKEEETPETTTLLQGKSKRRESPLKLRRRLQAARQKLQQSLLHVPHRVVVQPVARLLSVNTTRKIITGKQDVRIRDYVILPRVVRVLDKYTFTLGIMGMLLTELMVLEFPACFRYYYCVIMLPLLLLRVVLFQRTKQQYFLLDYCYWVNGLGFFLTLLPLLPLSVVAWQQEVLWQIFFVSANGPLFFAMIAWNNSLVFHSVDKVTSTYVHLFPALLSLTERWRSNQVMNAPTLPYTRHIGYPMLFYSTWQVVYLLQTEWWHKDILDQDPELSTSLRYLTSAEKMSINKKTLHLCRRMGWMGPTETFHPPTVKVKLIFVLLQALMTVVTFLPVRLYYEVQSIHYSVVVAILTFSVYNGARYYIQVFSKIYEQRYNDPQQPGDEEYVDTSAVMTEHLNNGSNNNGSKKTE